MHNTIIKLLIVLVISLSLSKENRANDPLFSSNKSINSCSKKDSIYSKVSISPKYIGGEKAMKTFIKENIQLPPKVKCGELDGVVEIEFVVEKDGSLSTFSIKNGLSTTCDKEAMRIAQLMPNWKRGRHKGKSVRVKHMIPIYFRENNEQDEQVSYFIAVENPPEYLEGVNALMDFIKENLRYPAAAKLNKIEGISYIGFTIDTTGRMEDFRLRRGFDKECDEEAMRLVKSLSGWKPAMQSGKPIEIEFTIPIHFELK